MKSLPSSRPTAMRDKLSAKEKGKSLSDVACQNKEMTLKAVEELFCKRHFDPPQVFSR